ncbi:MAG: hypothetical protein R3F54_03970 [Alphaproteobacteria bacterium]
MVFILLEAVLPHAPFKIVAFQIVNPLMIDVHRPGFERKSGDRCAGWHIALKPCPCARAQQAVAVGIGAF